MSIFGRFSDHIGHKVEYISILCVTHLNLRHLHNYTSQAHVWTSLRSQDFTKHHIYTYFIIYNERLAPFDPDLLLILKMIFFGALFMHRIYQM